MIHTQLHTCDSGNNYYINLFIFHTLLIINLFTNTNQIFDKGIIFLQHF